jgi:hypothetical protein
MKRSLILLMLLGLIAGSVSTAEAKKTVKPVRVERTVEATYTGPWLPFGNWDCAPSDHRGCVTITTGPRESFLTGKVTDAHGQPVLVKVWSEYESSGARPIFYGSFCGETTDPVRFPAGVTLKLWVGYFDPSVPECGVGLATTGTVDVTLSNLP